MKKIVYMFLASFVLLALTSCFGLNDITSISVDKAPDAYVKLEELIPADQFTVDIEAKGNTYNNLSITDQMLTVYGLVEIDGEKYLDTTSVGKKTVTVIYDSASVKISYFVAHALVNSYTEFKEAMETEQGIIVLMNNITVNLDDYFVEGLDKQPGVVIPAEHTKTFELNGHTISFTTDRSGYTALISNYGTLTIQDSTDENRDGSGTGKIIGKATRPDLSAIPGYASNTITNFGTLTINSGTIANETEDGASYVVDTYQHSLGKTNTSIFTLNGGKLISTKGDAVVRVWAYNATKMTTFIMNGGILEANQCGDAALWIQQCSGATAVKATVELNGGLIKNNGGPGVFDIGQTGTNFEGITVNFNGTTFEGGEGYFRINNSTFDLTASKLNVSVSSAYTKAERTENGRLYWTLTK